MGADSESFRKPLIEALRAVKAQRPDVQLHLLYSPELADPLALIDDTKRETALIRPPPLATQVIAPQTQNLPRLITLDCLRVAKYLMETDAGLDDPLFESSITQAHAEIVLQQRPDAGAGNDERGFSDLSIGGWLVSPESALTLALRIHHFSQLHSAGQGREWVRWTNPVYLSVLWPTMTLEQKQALLGEAIWLVFDVSGQLQRYAADEASSEHGPVPSGYDIRSLDIQQTHTVKNVPFVRDLLPRWQAMCEERGERLPNDAERHLHTQLQAAQAHGLDADSLVICVLTAVQLKRGATQDPEWVKLVRHAGTSGLPLRDEMKRLSDEFWDRWSLFDQDEDEWNHGH